MARARKVVTREAWFSSEYAGMMMQWLLTADARKLRLFACAACRQLWPTLPDEARELVEATEHWADGHVTRNQLQATRNRIEPGLLRSAHGNLAQAVRAVLKTATPRKGILRDLLGDVAVGKVGQSDGKGLAAAHAYHRQLLHDVFDYLFLDLPDAAAWRTPAVLPLAAALYEERRLPEGTLDVTRFALLADALEEAGCTAKPVLDHCRGRGPHVRGCWVLDLLSRG
jgi:hypothetical protein